MEQDGNPNKTIAELGKRDIGKTLGISMATAGLTKGAGNLCGVTNAMTLTNLATKYLIQSSVNTAMSVAIDGQSFEKAMRQGIVSATINTLAALGAGKIGDLRDADNPDRIDSGTQKLLHGMLGGLSGGLSSKLSGGSFEEGLKSGAFGAVIAETLAEGLSGDSQEQREHAGELAKLLTSIMALGTGLDPIIAYQTANNAIEHNFKMHPDVRLCLEDLGIIEGDKQAYGEGEDERTEQAYERGRVKYIKDSLDQARAIRSGRALSQDSHDMVVKNADIFYARSYWSGEATGYILEASTYIPGTTGLLIGVTEGIHGFVTGKYDALGTVQSVVSSSMGVLGKGGKALKSGMKLGGKIGDKGSKPSGNVPEFMTTNKTPANFKAAINRDTKAVDKPVRRPFEAEDVSTRFKLFGTDEVFKFKNDRVRMIGGQMPDNHMLAGTTYHFDKVKDPALRNNLREKYPHGVPFNGSGFADFSRYAVKKVDVQVTGMRKIDEKIANSITGLKVTPEGFTWHHHYDGKTMMLVPNDIHARYAVPHTGGVSVLKGKK